MDLPSNIRELIVAHHQAGKRSREIGQMLSVSKSVVNNILKRYRNTGSVDPTRVGKCGRPRLLSDRDERMLARASVANPTFNARDLRACVGGSVAQVSVNTIKRALRRKGRFAYRPSKSSDLIPVKRAGRLKWCRKYRHFTVDQWRKVRRFIVFLVSCIHNINFLLLLYLFRRSSLMKPTLTIADANHCLSDAVSVNLWGIVETVNIIILWTNKEEIVLLWLNKTTL